MQVSSLSGVVVLVVFTILIVIILMIDSNPTVDQKNHVQSLLPSNCRIIDLGEYGKITELVAVVCQDRNTTSVTQVTPHGKSKRTTSAFVIE